MHVIFLCLYATTYNYFTFQFQYFDQKLSQKKYKKHAGIVNDGEMFLQREKKSNSDHLALGIDANYQLLKQNT